MKKKKARSLIRNQRTSLTLIFSGFVFSVLLIALGLSTLILFAVEVLMGESATLDTPQVLLLVVVSSVIMGSGAALLLSKFPLTPINKLVNAMNRLATGDYNVRLEFKGPFYNNSTFREISGSFNRMAEELENTELLRSDFINNFSHEFKTPIVSITGFAKLLRRANLSDEERAQYLGVIESESLRLSQMATNVLNLTKVENQSILGDTNTYNLSEQLRSSLLVLEPKWTAKNIEIAPDFAEHDIEAAEELLKEVWINLIDNAIKFSPEGGAVSIGIKESESSIAVSVSNLGEAIPEDKRERIFGKFYQADESHSGQGNGVGLAIVKRVVELHGGDVRVLCSGGINTFVVTLPKKARADRSSEHG